MLEGAERRTSMCKAYYLTFIFERGISFRSGAIFNANFAWKQDEVPQNSRYAERFYNSR